VRALRFEPPRIPIQANSSNSLTVPRRRPNGNPPAPCIRLYASGEPSVSLEPVAKTATRGDSDGRDSGLFWRAGREVVDIRSQLVGIPLQVGDSLPGADRADRFHEQLVLAFDLSGSTFHCGCDGVQNLCPFA
jgi:hypothetical protein